MITISQIQSKLKLNDKQTLALLVIVSVLIVYLDFSFIISKQFSGIRRMEPNLVTLRNSLGILTKDLNQMRASRALLGQAAKTTSAVKKVITEQDLPSVLQNIFTIAAENKVKISKISPQKEASDTKRLKSPAGLKPYFISLEFDCGYDNLVKFLDSLYNAEVFMAGQNMSVVPGKEGFLAQKVELSLRLYVKK